MMRLSDTIKKEPTIIGVTAGKARYQERFGRHLDINSISQKLQNVHTQRELIFPSPIFYRRLSMNVFEEIKHRTDIREVAELFGVRINKHNKAICFIHSESNPSLSFKDNYFRCFSCGASGDVITMVSHIRGVQPIEAARIIDSIYGFNLFDNKRDVAEIRQQIKRAESDKKIIQSFRQWESHAFMVLSNRYWEIRERANIILKPNDPHLQRHITELAELPFIEYLLDEMIENTSDRNKQIEFYKLYERTIDGYEQLCTTSRDSA